jgi:uncharacterized protein YyaL (SSP411 family)
VLVALVSRAVEAVPTAAEIAKLPPDGGPEFNRSSSRRARTSASTRGIPSTGSRGRRGVAKAKAEEKPVFLSVGYSTCHWCHVMEKESFEDAEVAALLNASFVCVKVDREERPDVDQVYMAVTQAMTGSGGWPMTVIDAGAEAVLRRHVRPEGLGRERTGLMRPPRVVEAWKSKRTEIDGHADEVAAWLARNAGDAPAEGPRSTETLERPRRSSPSAFDAQEGGFATRRIPAAAHAALPLRWWKRSATRTRSRWSRRRWTRWPAAGSATTSAGVPPLLDGPAVARPPLREDALRPGADRARVRRGVRGDEEGRYRERRARDARLRAARPALAEGGFFSAEDADSEASEGSSTCGRADEIVRALGEEEGDRFARAYGASELGNVREAPGRSVLHVEDARRRTRLPSSREAPRGPDRARVRSATRRSRATGTVSRSPRSRSRGARSTSRSTRRGEARRRSRAREARRRQGRLLKRRAEGESAHAAVLDDYAFLVWGLIELYETDFDVRWLSEAVRLADAMTDRFWDASKGGFFFTASDSEALLARTKEIQDGATPSGNSVAALDFLRLGHLTGRPPTSSARRSRRRPSRPRSRGRRRTSPRPMIAARLRVGPASEIVIAEIRRRRHAGDAARRSLAVPPERRRAAPSFRRTIRRSRGSRSSRGCKPPSAERPPPTSVATSPARHRFRRSGPSGAARSVSLRACGSFIGRELEDPIDETSDRGMPRPRGIPNGLLRSAAAG